MEWTTRYRPVHIGTLLLGAVAPQKDSEFLYTDGGEFAGEAETILDVVGPYTRGRSAETTLAEFQRSGFLLAYVLDCPLEHKSNNAAATRELLAKRFPAMLTRIRRSLKPKKLIPISQLLEPLMGQLEKAAVGCAVTLNGGKPFALDGTDSEVAIRLLRRALRP